MKKLFLLLMPCLLSLAACEKSIKVDLPDQPSRLVLNAVVEVGDTIRLSLSRSMSIKESGKHIYTGVIGAHVVLYVDGNPADTLRAVANEDSSEYVSRMTAIPGRKYRLHVDAAGFESVDASTEAPEQVLLTSYAWKPGARQGPNGSMEDEFSIGFTDPGGTSDFYIVRIAPAYDVYEYADFYSWESCVYSSDPAVETSSADPLGENLCLPASCIFVRDALFNGTQKLLRLSVSSGLLNPWDDGSGELRYARVYLHHVTGDFYDYLKSYWKALDASGNPFVEPFNVSSNVRNGYGVFAILASSRYEIE